MQVIRASVLSIKLSLFPVENQNNRSEDRKQEILNIIEKEFNLELLLKYREMRILEHEIERGKELKELLEKIILNGNLN